MRVRTFAVLAVVLALVVGALAMWAPRGADAAPPTLKVTPSTDLGNQVVRVDWSGFPVTQDDNNYVWIYQCKRDPKSVNDCFQSVRPPSGPSVIPPGTAFLKGQTDGNGNGVAFLEVRPASQLPELNCTAANPCSILAFPVGLGTVVPDGALPAGAVTAPLEFAHSPSDCPQVSNFDVRTEGEATASHALYKWSATTCTAAQPLSVDYTESSGVAGRRSFLSGAVDIGITSMAATKDEAATRPAVYSPIDVNAVAIAFNVTDPVTGQRITDMKLTPRLVALMIAGNQFFGPGSTLFSDPEFLKLNPGHTWPFNAQPPLLRAEANDDTVLVTRWLQEDPAARRFLDDGEAPTYPVDPSWKNIAYPTDIFEARDEITAGTYQPRQGTTTNARRLFLFQPPGDGTTLIPGNDGIFALIDLVTAKSFGFPVAQLVPADAPNASAVAPDSAGLEKAVKAAKFDDATKMLQTDVTAGGGAYPLAKVDYAMAPAAGIDSAKAAHISQFLQFAANDGQKPDSLDPGYLPLTDELKAQAAAASAAVLAGAQAAPPSDGSDVSGGETANDFGSTSDFGTFGDSSSSFDDTTASALGTDGTGEAGGSSDTKSGGVGGKDAKPLSARFLGSQGQFVLPALLALALAALLAGPLLFVLLRPRSPKPGPPTVPETDPVYP